MLFQFLIQRRSPIRIDESGGGPLRNPLKLISTLSLYLNILLTFKYLIINQIIILIIFNSNYNYNVAQLCINSCNIQLLYIYNVHIL